MKLPNKQPANTMLSNSELKHIFETRYDRSKWISVLKENFGLKEAYAEPRSVKLKPGQDLASEYFVLGKLITKDDREIGVYEVPVSSGVKIERNKVGLRNLLKEVYKNEVDAAFVVFDQKKKWRFTYVSEITVRAKDGGREKKKTDPKRYTYLMGEGERCKTAADRFTKLRTTSDLFGEGVTLNAIEEAFSVDKLSKSFFDEYRKHYGRFTKYLTGKDENNKEVGKPHPLLKSVFNGQEKEARDFVKKMLGRIVFLYFLEKKGWLGVPEDKSWGYGDENFLSNLFRDCIEKGNFYQQVLVPLYFNTLNEERSNDLFKIRASLFSKPGYNKVKIPYLNGGLFDNDEKHTDNLVFPQEVFAGLFDFFDQYNFTVYEDSPDEHTVAVDPEMLGHIFENLLEDNKDKGAYYTPKEIVHYMCRESLIEYLYTKLNPDEKAETVKREKIERLVLHHEAADVIEHDETILTALKEVKICDPAIGSGAFPMGLLLEIFHLVETLYDVSPDVTTAIWKLGKGWNPAKVKEEIIQNSIYGVDIEKGAVDIARLRFWLSLIVDENTPRPLPNLDYKIVVGDSLLSKFEDEVIDIDWTVNMSKGVGSTREIMKDQELKLYDLQHKQHLYFHVKGDKTKLQQEIRNLKIDILINQLTLSRLSFVQANPKLGGFAPTAKEIQKNLETEIRIAGYDKTIGKLKKLKENKTAALHFFDWKLDFPEVMNEKVVKGDVGFDVVIANPPYVVLQDDNAEKTFLPHYKQKFITASYKIDLYHLFIEKGMKLLEKKGNLVYINPANFLTNNYTVNLRKFILQNGRILKLVSIDDDVFEASVNTCILQVSTQWQDDNRIHFLKANLEKDTIHFKPFSSQKQTDFMDGDFLLVPVESDEVSKVIRKIESNSIRLIENFRVNFGMQLRDRQKFPNDVLNNPSESKLSKYHKKCITGKDFSRYFIKYNNRYCYFNRKAKMGGCWDEEVHFQSNKILVRQVGSVPICAMDHWGYPVLNSAFMITPENDNYDTYTLLGILNSKAISFYWENKFGDKRKTFPKIKGTYLEQLPIPKRHIKNIGISAKRIQKSKNSHTNNTQELEREIDLMVYKLFNLNYEDICIIEGNTNWMNKEEYENFKIE